MADISKIQVGNTTYDLKDVNAARTSDVNGYTPFQITAPNGGNVSSQACWYNKATKMVHISATVLGGSWTGNTANPLLIPETYRTTNGTCRGLATLATSNGYITYPVSAGSNGYINQSISTGVNFTQMYIEMTYHL